MIKIKIKCNFIAKIFGGLLNYTYICTKKIKMNFNTATTMRTLHRTPKVSRERAVQIAANHNCVSKDVAATYTDSELKEVLRQLKLKAAF